LRQLLLTPPQPKPQPNKDLLKKRKGKPKMAKLSSEDLLTQFKEMTLVELSDFVKAFETEFDVTAAAPVAAAAAGGATEAAAEQDEFTLTIEAAGSQKIAVIKEVRGINSSLGLKEAKDLVDACPAVLIEKGTKEAVEKAKAALEAAGATVSVK
jgi:large subunit ribosomal protein L7/L12